MMNRKTEFLLGFIPALIMPVICIAAFIHFKYENTFEVLDVLKQLYQVEKLYNLLPIGAIPNLLYLFFAMKKERWLLGRGIMSATLISSAIVIAM